MILRRHVYERRYLIYCMFSNSPSLGIHNRYIIITDLTLELNILICFDFQFLLRMRKATRAFLDSVPSVLLILLPRYVKQSVSSSGFPSTVTSYVLALRVSLYYLFSLASVNKI